MRLPVPLLILLAAPLIAPAEASASSASANTPATRTVSFRPRAWQPPVARAVHTGAARVGTPGMIEGDVLPETPGGLGLTRAEALSRVKIETHADGSRHATLNGAIRMYSVASVDESGKLHLDCASSEADAIARVRKGGQAATPAQSSPASTARAPRGGK